MGAAGPPQISPHRSPQGGGTPVRIWLGALRLKWERHGDFSGYTFLLQGLSPAFPVTRVAAQVESGLALSQFRFGACSAYTVCASGSSGAV